MCNVDLAEEPLEGSRVPDAHLVSIPLVGVLSRGCWRAGLLLHRCSLPVEDLEEEKSLGDNDETQNVHRQMRASEVRGRRVGSRVRPTRSVEKNQESEANPTCSGCVALVSTLC